MYAFLALLTVLVALFVVAKAYTKEGFVGFVPLNTDSKPIIPDNIPTPVNDDIINPEMASNLPGGLPTAPYQQIGRNLPTPYAEPRLVRTTRQRILNVLESLKGFLAFQATEIEDRSDPSIQLPLQTARGDFQRLVAEANVLQRNPGLTPHMTAMDIAQIEDNLAYLQVEAEMVGVNRPYQSSQHDADLEEGFESGDRTPATLPELINFTSRIQATITSLSASGTTDPNVQARIGNLTAMMADVDAVITKIQSGAILSNQVPILRSDIDRALPVLGNMSAALPSILRNLAHNAGQGGNADILNTLVRYAEKIFSKADNGFSFSVDYDVKKGAIDGDMDLSHRRDGYENQSPYTTSVGETGFPSMRDLDQVAESPEMNRIRAPKDTTDPWSRDPRAEGRPSMPFDWRRRSNAIIEQIRKREMNPVDFGAMPMDAVVSDDFGWKGYTKMICTRLMSVEQNKMDEMCGCPPQDWSGWGGHQV
jgi:hypothetical protein